MRGPSQVACIVSRTQDRPVFQKSWMLVFIIRSCKKTASLNLMFGNVRRKKTSPYRKPKGIVIHNLCETFGRLGNGAQKIPGWNPVKEFHQHSIWEHLHCQAFVGGECLSILALWHGFQNGKNKRSSCVTYKRATRAVVRKYSMIKLVCWELGKGNNQ